MTTESGANRPGRHLSDEQVRFFDENGYLLLRDWIPAELLENLLRASESWIAEAHGAEPTHPHWRDFQFGWPEGRRALFKIEQLHSKGSPTSLELLGSPAVLGVAESLCGRDFVPTYEALVVKQQDGAANVPWHQDAVHPRTSRIFNYGLYLDASHAGEGALQVLPGTHLAAQDICSTASAYGWDAPGSVTLEVGPGDVLLHDVMVVHGSAQVTGNRRRRTIYFEFRSAPQILAEGPWDRDTVARRMRLIPPALDRHRAAFPDAAQFPWRASAEFRPAPGDPAPELRQRYSVSTPGTYCSAGNATGSVVARSRDVAE